LPPNNLPAPQTSFVGRQAESAEVQRFLRTSRVVTLTGSPGSGKTRLALHVAAAMVGEFPGGVWWCDLAGVADPGLVAAAVGATLQVQPSPGQSLAKVVAGAIGRNACLLLLDNCEHVLAACAALAFEVLRESAPLVILSTSLQPLGLPQEVVWSVPAMAVPEGEDVESLARSDAIQLFVERARRVNPAFRLTEHNARLLSAICRRLDGLPLAVELAASRTRLLTVEQIAERLDDVFGLLTRGSSGALSRHRTLRTAMEWSYQFLSVTESSLLCRLSVFTAAFTLSMAEQVAKLDGGPAATLDGLTGLAERSFLTVLPTEDRGEASYVATDRCRLGPGGGARPTLADGGGG